MINPRFAAVRRLAYEVADTGLLSPELAARDLARGEQLGGSSRHAEVAAARYRRTCARLCHVAGGELEQIQFLLGHVSVETTERSLGCKQRLRVAVNDNVGLEP